jgi:hypothetical protein
MFANDKTTLLLILYVLISIIACYKRLNNTEKVRISDLNVIDVKVCVRKRISHI